MLIRVGRTTPKSLLIGFCAVVDPTGFFAIVLAVVFRVTFFSFFCTTGFVLVVRFFVVLVAVLGRLVAAFLFGVVGFWERSPVYLWFFGVYWLGMASW